MKTWRISLKQGVVLIEFDDGTVLGPETLLDIYQTLSNEPEKYRTVNSVYDLRNIMPADEVGFKQMMELVKSFKRLRQSEWKHQRTALVVSSKIAYGLSRMYASLVEENLDYEVKIFNEDLEMAIKWAQAQDQAPDQPPKQA
jgi:hypothetical protein